MIKLPLWLTTHSPQCFHLLNLMAPMPLLSNVTVEPCSLRLRLSDILSSCISVCAEASYTLLLYDELLEWSERPLREFLSYPMQSEWQRKEYLHLTIIQNFDRGKVWIFCCLPLFLFHVSRPLWFLLTWLLSAHYQIIKGDCVPSSYPFWLSGTSITYSLDENTNQCVCCLLSSWLEPSVVLVDLDGNGTETNPLKKRNASENTWIFDRWHWQFFRRYMSQLKA